MTQTAVEWLIEQVNSDCLNSTFISQELIIKAKAMEKEQIVDAYDNGSKEWTPIEYSDGQHYYNETYNL
jgi:hypothetical protein